MTVYLLEIMAIGLVLFGIAMLWDKRQREKLDTDHERSYAITLGGEEYAFLDVMLRRAQPHDPRTTPKVSLPRKTSAK